MTVRGYGAIPALLCWERDLLPPTWVEHDRQYRALADFTVIRGKVCICKARMKFGRYSPAGITSDGGGQDRRLAV